MGSRRAEGLLPHVAREWHDENHPVHVTMRRVRLGPSFRSQRVTRAIVSVIERSRRNGVRVVHYSVQDTHIHLMVEGRDSADLSNQMRTLFSRVAFAVNAITRRHGKLFRDRHHRHELKTPREVRNALVYILFNDRKHRAANATTAASRIHVGSKASVRQAAGLAAVMPGLDPCSSAWWFHQWAPWDHPPRELLRDAAEAPTAKPRTWLAGIGWTRGLGGRRDGRLRFSECPGVTLT